MNEIIIKLETAKARYIKGLVGRTQIRSMVREAMAVADMLGGNEETLELAEQAEAKANELWQLIA